MTTNAALATSAHSAPRPTLRAPSRLPAHAAPGGDLDLVIQLAHDLRSPLSGILMLAECLRDGAGGSVTESQRRLLDLIHGAALSLCGSASDVVELALDGRTISDECPAPFAVSDVLRTVREMVSPLAAGKNLELRVTGPTFDRREGRARALTRVLLNLTTNALKCTEHGVVEIVARESGSDPDRIECSVRDSGPGFQAGVFRAIEEPRREGFAVRGECLTSAGLGLTICRRLVQQMCSSLQFESSPGRGARFHFELYAPRV